MPSSNKTPAFAFDIDGVLVKGSKALPGARETLQHLQAQRIPFIFLTNGGGHTEAKHLAKLEQRLNMKLDPRQFVQSHTPFYDLVPEYRTKTVLVLGGSADQIRDLALAYGFTRVVTSSDVMVERDHVHPFPEMAGAHHRQYSRCYVTRGHEGNLATTPIAAILVWTSPRDWCLDLQLINDLLLSKGGFFGTRSEKNGDPTLPNCGYLQDGQPKLFLCNPDFKFSTQHSQPRFAQGAFREALRGIWEYETDGRATLEYSMVGKPSDATYVYGERKLTEWNTALNDESGSEDLVEDKKQIDSVYMIGDNPESDIIGANIFQSRSGLSWTSVLVETGVYMRGTVPKHLPKHTTTDVKAAVEWALQREGVEAAVVATEEQRQWESESFRGSSSEQETSDSLSSSYASSISDEVTN